MGMAASEKGPARAELGHQESGESGESGDTGGRVRAVVSIQQDLCVFRCLRLGSGGAKAGHSSPAFTEWAKEDGVLCALCTGVAEDWEGGHWAAGLSLTQYRRLL